jgi:hypothetical protein
MAPETAARINFLGETTLMNNGQIPNFDFVLPKGYRWLIDRKLVGFDENSPLRPWHYLSSRWAFDLSKLWPNGPEDDLSERWPKEPMRLFAFAKRQDNDDLACFEVVGNQTNRVVLVHGWTSRGYCILQTYDTFWEWLKAVVDDVEEWVDPPDDELESR